MNRRDFIKLSSGLPLLIQAGCDITESSHAQVIPPGYEPPVHPGYWKGTTHVHIGHHVAVGTPWWYEDDDPALVTAVLEWCKNTYAIDWVATVDYYRIAPEPDREVEGIVQLHGLERHFRLDDTCTVVHVCEYHGPPHPFCVVAHPQIEGDEWYGSEYETTGIIPYMEDGWHGLEMHHPMVSHLDKVGVYRGVYVTAADSKGYSDYYHNRIASGAMYISQDRYDLTECDIKIALLTGDFFCEAYLDDGITIRFEQEGLVQIP